MSKWTHKRKKFTLIPEGAWGFTYKITCKETGQYYIGLKQFYSNTNGKVSKKRSLELWSGKGRKPTRERKSKESDWQTYISSSKAFKEYIQTRQECDFKWEILEIFYSKTELELGEAREIIDSMCDPLCQNLWLKLTIYKKNLDCQKN